MVNALFDINGDGQDQGFTGAASQALVFKLRDDPAPGVSRVQFQVFDSALFDPDNGIAGNPPRSTPGAPLLLLDNGAGSTGQIVQTSSTTAPTAPTVLPASGVHSWLVRCIVNGGVSVGAAGTLVPDPTLIHERIVAIPNNFGTRKPITTETTQFEDDGWGQVLCDLVENEGNQQLDWKDSVRAATDGALPAYTRSGSVITADAVGALPLIDGVDLNVGDSFLDKDNPTSPDRGVYVLDVKGDGGTAFSATRRSDYDESSEVTSMAAVPVSEGTVSGPSGIPVWQLITPDDITINVTGLTFQAFGTGGGGGGGSGLTLAAQETGSFTAVVGVRTLFDPSVGGLTVMAPAGPSVGDEFAVKINVNDTTLFTFSGNGSDIEDPLGAGFAATQTGGGGSDDYHYTYDGTKWVQI